MSLVTHGRTTALPVLAGLLLFSVLMGISVGLVGLNARWSPSLPWFPLPALALVLGASAWLERRWGIGLTWPRGVDWRRIYLVGGLATIAALAIGVLQGALHGLVREAPTWPGAVSGGFQLAYLLTLPLIASVLAEVTFRGVMQVRLTRRYPLWRVLGGLAVLNTLFHFNAAELGTQWACYLALNLAFGYAAWLAGSIVPALVLHVGMNLVVTFAERLWGPFDLGALGPGALLVTGAVGLGAALLAAWSRPRREPATR